MGAIPSIRKSGEVTTSMAISKAAMASRKVVLFCMVIPPKSILARGAA
jgi:hypothetical protein